MSGNLASSDGWIDIPLRISHTTLARIVEHATEQYPSECCGFISGPASAPAELRSHHPEANEADKYHKLDPIRFPRTSAMYFKINELRASRAFEDGAAAGEPIKVIYHSHCDAGAYFSEEDAATFAQDRVLMWPCQFLVVSVLAGVPAGHKLWKFDPAQDQFVDSILSIEEPLVAD